MNLRSDFLQTTAIKKKTSLYQWTACKYTWLNQWCECGGGAICLLGQ